MRLPMMGELYVLDSFYFDGLVKNIRSMQDEVGFRSAPYAIWQVVAKTQETVS